MKVGESYIFSAEDITPGSVREIQSYFGRISSIRNDFVHLDLFPYQKYTSDWKYISFPISKVFFQDDFEEVKKIPCPDVRAFVVDGVLKNLHPKSTILGIGYCSMALYVRNPFGYLYWKNQEGTYYEAFFLNDWDDISVVEYQLDSHFDCALYDLPYYQSMNLQVEWFDYVELPVHYGSPFKIIFKDKMQPGVSYLICDGKTMQRVS